MNRQLRNARSARVIVILSALAASATFAKASAVFYASGKVETIHPLGDGTVDTSQCSYGYNSNFGINNPTVPSGSMSCSYSGIAGGTSTASADVQGDHVFASSSTLGAYTSNNSSQTGSEAEVSDTFTIDAPGLTGLVGYFVPVIQVDGSFTDTGTGFSSAVFSEVGCCSGYRYTYFSGLVGGANAINTQVNTSQFSFVFGSATFFAWDLQVTTSIDPGLATGPDVSGTATANFSNTAALTGFSVFDSSNNAIGNATITSDGTINYQAIYSGQASSTPEPSTAAMMLTALLAAGAMWNRRRAITSR